MIKLSAMRNCPVILRNKRSGFLQNVRLSMERKEASALIVSCGLRGKQIVPSDEIESITSEYILVRGLHRFCVDTNENRRLFVRDTSGRLLGRVSDYAIDQDTLRILAIEMMSGYLPKDFRNRMWIYNFAYTNELIVPSQIGSVLINME